MESKSTTMIGKWILVTGLVLLAVGAFIWLAESLGLPLGRFPGDFRMKGEGWSVRCIVLSIVLTVLLIFVSGKGNLGK
jgi:hypothetical protein